MFRSGRNLETRYLAKDETERRSAVAEDDIGAGNGLAGTDHRLAIARDGFAAGEIASIDKINSIIET
ncbi:hypothetical protein SAMN05892877_10245 [Rhizobium subbaraonis]|uniref:Uncharacterized protein n=1 Tax=Rhizobium subbaraonis TaxID=908946 RepID=A0A285U1K3_9HYPH|nr:hypothetical protein SAMN05892877_10245 [Rhizobium subbaraonis]